MPNYLTTQIPNVIQTATYFTPPQGTSFPHNTIAQPVGSYPILIPGVMKPLQSLVTLPPGAASWFSTSISQPYFPALDIHPYTTSPFNVGTYFTPPPAPTGTAAWLASTISQPYFTPYDENKFVYPPDSSTYAKRPIPPTGIASWLRDTINQPYITPYDELFYGIPPVDVGTYAKAPPPPNGSAGWLANGIAQPFAQKQFLPSYDVNAYVWPANPATYAKATPAPVGVASWLATTIAQPYFPFAFMQSFLSVLFPPPVVAGHKKVMRHLPNRMSRLGRMSR